MRIQFRTSCISFMTKLAFRMELGQFSASFLRFMSFQSVFRINRIFLQEEMLRFETQFTKSTTMLISHMFIQLISRDRYMCTRLNTTWKRVQVAQTFVMLPAICKPHFRIVIVQHRIFRCSITPQAKTLKLFDSSRNNNLLLDLFANGACSISNHRSHSIATFAANAFMVTLSNRIKLYILCTNYTRLVRLLLLLLLPIFRSRFASCLVHPICFFFNFM